jgi:uncharacterized protein
MLNVTLSSPLAAHRPTPAALRLCLCAALLAGLSGVATAYDLQEGGAPPPPPKGTLFKSVGEAIREGIRGLKGGDPTSAVEPLTFAAREGNVAAQWRLGHMYAVGEGVRRDDYKAYQNFSQIVNLRADEAPDSPQARVVSQAFVALGRYHLTGIPNTRVKRDPTRAQEMFHYAASYYNSAEAQYQLGKMISEGALGNRDPQQAARWYNLAAEQGHHLAQARLGNMLFNGEGVPRQAPRGLMWVMAAKMQAVAEPVRDAWVLEVADNCVNKASEDERRLAEAMLSRRARANR